MILDNLFTGIANTTSVSIGWEGIGVGEEPQSGGLRLRLYQNQPNDIHWCHFYLHISHKAAKSMAKLISQVCDELQPADCLSRSTQALVDVRQALVRGLSKSRLFNFLLYIPLVY